MKAVAEVIGVSRSNLIERLQGRPKKRLGRTPLPDDELVADIKAVIAGLPTYGYRRVHAILKRQALAAGRKPPNHKPVYRVMKVCGLLLDRHVGGVERWTMRSHAATRLKSGGKIRGIVLTIPNCKEEIAGRSQLRLATFLLPTHREVVAAAFRISALGAPTQEAPGSRAFHAACLHSTPPRLRINLLPVENYTRSHHR